VTDFETKLKQGLNRSVDARLGARRTPPPFQPVPVTGARRHGIRPWVAPLAAAACVVLALVVTLTTTTVLSAPPAATPPAPSPTVVQLGAARIWLPGGWVARSYQLYRPSIEPMAASPSWCLTPDSTPVSTAPGACPVAFGTLSRPRTTHIDSDVEGGIFGNPLYCIPRDGGTSGLNAYEAADVRFGGRLADFRDWRFGCGDGSSWWIQQYLVASDPGYMMLSEVVTPGIAAAMKGIVAHSTLPTRTSALRYFDEGTVLKSTQVAGSVRIRLERQFLSPAEKAHSPNPAQVDYLIPLSMFRQQQNLFRPHSQVGICTDGTTVFWAFAA
jgi:hypothetical protein